MTEPRETSRDGPPGEAAFSAFRAPANLALTHLAIDRALLIGQCLLQPWIKPIETIFSPGTKVDFVLFNNLVELPDQPPHAVIEYAVQVVSLPLRVMLPETAYLGLAYSDATATAALFQGACERLDVMLRATLKWNIRHGLLTFVANFLVPQQNPDGRLLPRYDLRNMVFFIEKLNQHLASSVAAYRGVHIVDIDAIAATIGRRYVQDDALWIHSHGSILYDHDAHHDRQRLAPPPHPASVEFGLRTEHFIGEVWREIEAMLRTIRRIDSVKMVIVDLDDTLWRGVLAEEPIIHKVDAEGWPLGVVEALMYLKRRGILLAIASKNDEATVARIFDELYAFRIHLSDFALKRINWLPKADNIAAMLAEANLLAQNVVFIDDNPVEREAVQRAFPAMRVLGASLYAIRRDLLWSAETQVANITSESERRGKMVEAQGAREDARKAMTRADFLATLGLGLMIFDVADRDANFARAFELLNKTNQFNTTGRRWREDEIAGRMADGLRLIAFRVGDRFTSYGLVGVLLVEAETLVQFVMSCRVIGLGIEQAAVKIVAAHLGRAGVATLTAAFSQTPDNFPCRDLFASIGFDRTDAGWIIDIDQIADPSSHIQIEVDLEPYTAGRPSPSAQSAAMPSR